MLIVAHLELGGKGQPREAKPNLLFPVSLTFMFHKDQRSFGIDKGRGLYVGHTDTLTLNTQAAVVLEG